jgi:hypothetical protein
MFCLPGLMPLNEEHFDFIILGATFLRAYYTQFDSDNLEIGAQWLLLVRNCHRCVAHLSLPHCTPVSFGGRRHRQVIAAPSVVHTARPLVPAPGSCTSVQLYRCRCRATDCICVAHHRQAQDRTRYTDINY